jgi:CubicO group peptidase (beta-lactamase class C family)
VKPARLVALVGVLIAAAVGLLIVLGGGDLPYIARVLVHQDASTSDVDWKDSVAIEASDPRPWPEDGSCAGIDSALAEVGGIDSWMTAGGGSALVVAQNGSLQCEWSAPGLSASTALPVFSISKSVMAVVLARAIDDGAIPGWDAPMTDLVPELAARDERFTQITYADLVDMRSGIAFSENADFPWVNQDASRVYYASDLAAAVLRYPTISSDPGTFTYNDYAPNLVGLALSRSPAGPLVDDAMPQLWRELGAQDDAAWLVDGEGFAWHESGFVASARDVARVGQLLLDGGAVGDRTVAPPEFAERVGSPRGSEIVQTWDGLALGYTTGWWVVDDGRAFVALGRFGQVMVVVPSSQTVIVRLGEDGYERVESNAAIADRLIEVAVELD